VSPRRLPEWVPARRDTSDEGREPPFDPASWSGALITMGVIAALLWIVQIVNAAHDYSFNRFGLQPRQVDGLWGVLTEPLLHRSYGHMFSDTLPLVAIGWALLLSGLRTWLIVTASVLVISGLAAWLVAPSGLVVGSSALVFGWMAYLLARAYFSRKIKWILTAVLVLFFFGTLLASLLPSFDSNVPWQVHACGFGAGIVVGALLHPRGARRTGSRAPQRPVVS
jgi:membrane associated rhomboid family serine protease